MSSYALEVPPTSYSIVSRACSLWTFNTPVSVVVVVVVVVAAVVVAVVVVVVVVVVCCCRLLLLLLLSLLLSLLLLLLLLLLLFVVVGCCRLLLLLLLLLPCLMCLPISGINFLVLAQLVPVSCAGVAAPFSRSICACVGYQRTLVVDISSYALEVPPTSYSIVSRACSLWSGHEFICLRSTTDQL